MFQSDGTSLAVPYVDGQFPSFVWPFLQHLEGLCRDLVGVGSYGPKVGGRWKGTM